MYKNWNAICECEDPVLRLLLSVSQNPAILAGLQHGFPEYFTQEKQAEPRAPLSAVRHAITHNTSAELTMAGVLDEKFGIPAWWFADESHEGQIGPVPGEWVVLGEADIMGDIAHVMYANEDCIVIESSSESYCTIAPAKFFDLNA
ncbi:hypothetical protein A2763_04695 [Candidatus Kaiserbacteria bacterium RIFCSPHIGHO2_01_FULL_54_36]|uniref:Uncharacterized protein n=1 Tax=Candidatus Kaiserbacteria bacterium RIFCSPHIGHO2_01_FULL_54_36 TaxID=1798482 RepID=A0A1F6CMG6_9BACT|nr:MAG: hypothetical protein A2763_04695 [Candidatus Kaiserbacteria bacterium RIFCSPHIGHO2_01_FULL_54_36]OGG75066.1 MAG: hypothetical protein A3A41_02125 [Candidatus Kaiserbacteria bacterium RIFCSPLOWO2_01_FULL_54_22]